MGNVPVRTAGPTRECSMRDGGARTDNTSVDPSALVDDREPCFEPLFWRLVASQLWTSRLTPLSRGSKFIDGGNYFIDRIAYDAFLGIADPTSNLPPFRYSTTDYPRNLATWLRADGLVDPALYPPSIAAVWRPSPFFCDLVTAWNDFLLSLEIATFTHFDPRQFGTITDFYSRSVYYPAPPAIPGPLFLGVLGGRQTTILRAVLGEPRLIDFALALSQIHEGSHFLQTGDPLLAEFAWSRLWMSFLDVHGLWALQRNLRTGVTCNLEAPYWRDIELTGEQIRQFFLDTYVGIRNAYSDGSARYQRCCSLSHLVYSGSLSYEAFLSRLAGLLRTR
jgi:hypothetical protein